MGSSQRMAAVAAVAHAKHYYNHTTPAVQPDTSTNNINFIFASATLCGVLVMVCAACWRRRPSSDKPDDVTECRGIYTVSADSRLSQVQMDLPGPPPAYETVVVRPVDPDKEGHSLQEVVTDPRSTHSRRCDELPSYEAAVMLKDTKL